MSSNKQAPCASTKAGSQPLAAPLAQNPIYQTKLKGLAQAYKIDLTDDQVVSLLQHLDLVLEKNQVMNLTRITSVDDALILHILDSLLLLPSLKQNSLPSQDSSGAVLDIGTGAGFPGIPLALLTQRPFTLMDSVGKKVRAVDEFVNALDISDRVVTTNERAEKFALSHPKAYDFVVARAVARLPILIEYAEPFLVSHGQLVVSKGRLSDEELNSGIKAAQLAGMKLVSRETLELPYSMGHREILTFEKVAKPALKLPRPVGEAKKHPLG